MSDSRERKLADLLVNWSVRLKKGENCLINAVDIPIDMTEELVDAVYRAGGHPVVNLWSERLERAIAEGASEDSLSVWADTDAYRMRKMDAFIGMRGIANVREMASLPEKSFLLDKFYSEPVHSKIRVPKTKWVVLRYPTEIMAMQAGMSTREFRDYFYSVCTDVDYSSMEKAMEAAKVFLDKVDKVHIVAPGTDLSFSVKGLPWIPCAGRANIPDGEIYTAPVKTSVNGRITYNCPSTYHGHRFKDVSLTFKDGKIVEAHADDDVLLNKIFDTDEGSRYVGEFALGVNPKVNFPMDNTLFDEKIHGSFHFTPGCCYDECSNGNKSAIHWDLIKIMTENWGGGEMYMDGTLVRKNGVFCIPELEMLNLK